MYPVSRYGGLSGGLRQPWTWSTAHLSRRPLELNQEADWRTDATQAESTTPRPPGNQPGVQMAAAPASAGAGAVECGLSKTSSILLLADGRLVHGSGQSLTVALGGRGPVPQLVVVGMAEAA